MALKTWINETKKTGSGLTSEAQLDPACAPLEEDFPGEKEADRIISTAFDRIINRGIFYGTPETRAAEDDINVAYKAIIQGGKDFELLRKACVRWVISAQTKPEAPETDKHF